MFNIITISEKYGTKNFNHFFPAIRRTYTQVRKWVDEKFQNIKEVKIDTYFNTVTIIYNN